jgi:hypothetical protein
MVPGAIAFTITFSAMLYDQLIKLNAAEKSNQLTE